MDKFRVTNFLSAYEFHEANAVTALVVALGAYILMRAGLALARRHVAAEQSSAPGSAFSIVWHKTIESTSSIAVIATALLIGLAVLELPAPWDMRVRHLWFFGLAFQLTLYAHRALGVGIKLYFARQPGGAEHADSVAHTLIAWLLQTALWIVLALALLANLGINISTFIASLGIGGIAVALAVQNILGDLFASLSIAVDKPFEVGDAISVAGFSGVVEHVGLKTTRVRADSGEQIVIANSELLKDTVRNFKRMSNRRVQFTLRINPQTPHQDVAAVPPVLKEIVGRQDKVRFDRAHLKALDQAFIEFEVVYYVLTPSYADFMDCQQAVLLDVMAALDELGISNALAGRPLVLGDDKPDSKTGGIWPLKSALLKKLGAGKSAG